MLSGVAKSGSPISRCTTWRPTASRPRARASTSNAPSVPSRSIRSAKRIPMVSVNPPQGPAVDTDGLARDVARLARAEERARRPELVRVPDAPRRDAPRDVVQAARVQLVDAVGQDRA